MSSSNIFSGPIFLLIEYMRNPTPQSGMSLIIRIFAVLVLIFVLFPFHECAHALSAKLLGDDTAEREGRLTLNPFPHIDPMGAFIMLLLPLGWAKPVPVNPRNATRKVTMRGFMSLTAAAGPLSNVIFSLIFVILFKILWLFPMSEMLFYVAEALLITAQLSIFLAVFNLIPIPPLDGSKILYFFLNNKQVFFLERNMNIVRMVFLLVILFDPFNIFGIGISFVANGIMRGLDLITFFIK